MRRPIISGAWAVVLAALLVFASASLLVFAFRPVPAPPAPSDNGDNKPPKAVSELIEALNSPDSRERLTAARVLSERGEGAQEAWPRLAQILEGKGEADPDVRAAAAEALGKGGRSARLTAPALARGEQIDPDPQVRRAARDALARLGRPTRDDVPALASTLTKDERLAFRVLAARSLYLVGKDAADAVPDLEQALSDPEADVREVAALALARVGPSASKALPRLAALQKDPSPYVRGAAADALGSLGPDAASAVGALCELLQPDEEGFVQERAARALGNIGPAAGDRGRRALLAACGDRAPPAVRVEAALARWRLTAEAGSSVPVLVSVLGGTDAAVRQRALQGLHAIGPAASDALPDLVALLRATREPAALRAGAAAVLGRIGRDARLAYPTLHWASEKGDPAVRPAATAALAAVEKPTVNDLRALITALKKPGPPAWRVNAADALYGLGADADEAVPSLAQALADPNEEVRLAVLDALGQMGPETVEALRELRSALGDKGSAAVRAEAAAVIGGLGPSAKAAIPDLGVALTTDKVASVRLQAARALVPMEADAAAVLDALRTALNDPESAAVRITVAGILGRLGATAKKAVPDLGRSLTAEKDKKVRLALVLALGDMGKEAVEALQPLRAALNDEESMAVREAAARALGGLGPAASDAVPALGEALKQGDLDVRIAAAAALKELAFSADERATDLRKALEGVVEPLRQALTKANEVPLRLELCDALGALGETARPALDLLAGLMNDATDPHVRLHAAQAHLGIAQNPDLVLQVLRKLLAHDDVEVRYETAVALKTVSDVFKEKVAGAADDLVKRLEVDNDHRVRVFAALALWNVRKPLKKEQYGLVVPALIDALAEGDEEACLRAAEELPSDADLLKAAKLAYPLLLQLSEDPDLGEAVQTAAANASKKLGKPTEADLGVLTSRLKDRNYRCRVLAAECLRTLHLADVRAITALAEVVRSDEQSEPRVKAAAALGAIGAPAAPAVPDLVEALAHPKAEVRAAVAAALGQIGPDAKDAVEVLTKRFQDNGEEKEVRRVIGEALKKIDAQAAAKAGVH
jgi:HEAT repeat protein